MLGSARRRDERRKSSIERIKNNIAYWQSALKSGTDFEKKFAKEKVEKHQKVLDNTIANMGKGSATIRVRTKKE